MRKVIVSALVVILAFFLTGKSFSQKYHTTSSKALKAYKLGQTAFDYIDYESAERFFNQAILSDNGFFEAYVMLG